MRAPPSDKLTKRPRIRVSKEVREGEPFIIYDREAAMRPAFHSSDGHKPPIIVS